MRDHAVLAATDPALLAAIPVIGVVAAALIAGIFGQANRRDAARDAARTETDEARERLVDTQEKHIALLTIERDAALAQVAALEAKVRAHEGRATRGKA